MRKRTSLCHTFFTPIASVCLLAMIAPVLPAQRPEDRPLPPPPPVHAEFKFDFGPGKARDGYVPVLPDTMYSSEHGCGGIVEISAKKTFR